MYNHENFNLDTKLKILYAGGSKVFENWNRYTGITMDAFADGLRWLCADPLDEKGRLTREMGLRADGTVEHLKRVHLDLYYPGGSKAGTTLAFYDEDGKLWNGSGLIPNPQTIEESHGMWVPMVPLGKISISAMDRI